MSLRIPIPLEHLRAAHKGLLLDSYLPATTKDDAKRKALQAIARVDSSYPAYKLAFARWKDATQHCVHFEARVRDRLAIGLGNASVHEIGVRLHSTYGTPIIPGSSIKGAFRAFIQENPAYMEMAGFLFGKPDQAAFVRTLDAWWVPDGARSGFALDVITVHHQAYYSGRTAPADTESPTPVSWLNVTGKFYFAIEPPAGAPDSSWPQLIEKSLRALLQSRGLGAKTRAGYGHFI